MCSELFRIPYQWGGLPIFGFGVLLAVWAVVAAGSLGLSVRRHGWTAETWSLVPLLALTAAAILGLPKMFPGGLPVRGYGLMVLLGFSAGVAMAAYRAQCAGLANDFIWSLAFWLFIGGIVGARLFYVVEYWNERFRSDSVLKTTLRILDFPEGGLVVYGALLGGIVAVLVFLRKHRMPVLATLDLIAPSMVVGLAFGRIGCLLNGCCFGGPSTLPWALPFPPGSPPYEDQVRHGELYGFQLKADEHDRPIVGQIDAGRPAATAGLSKSDVVAKINKLPIRSVDEAGDVLSQANAAGQSVSLELESGRKIELPSVSPTTWSRPIHPTQLYAAITAGLLAWFLWAYYPLRRRDGEVLALMLTIYPVSRLMEEYIRTDEPTVFGTGLHISQNISLALLVFVVGLWIYLSKQPRGVAWPAQGSP